MSNVTGGASPKLGNISVDSVRLKQGDPATPQDGEVGIILDSDGSLKSIDSTGTKTALGSGGIESIVEGNGIAVDAADPLNPIVSAEPVVHVTTLGSVQTNLTVSGLDPATEGDYDVYGWLVTKVANMSIKLQPNGADANCASVTGDLFVGARRNDSSWVLSNASQTPLLFPSGVVIVVVGKLYAKTGRVRYADLRWFSYTGSTTNNAGNMFLYWNDSTTPLTSLTVAGGQASGLDVTSFLRLTASAQPS